MPLAATEAVEAVSDAKVEGGVVSLLDSKSYWKQKMVASSGKGAALVADAIAGCRSSEWEKHGSRAGPRSARSPNRFESLHRFGGSG